MCVIRVNTADSLGSFHNMYVTDLAVTVCLLFLVQVYRSIWHVIQTRLSWYRCTYIQYTHTHRYILTSASESMRVGERAR